MADDCVFCKIADGEIKADIVYEDAEVLAFKDINPQAPVHILLISKRHINTLNDINETDVELLGKLTVRAAKLASENRIAVDGYRLVVNCNRNAGQEVFHLHMHLLGGRIFAWPPG